MKLIHALLEVHVQRGREGANNAPKHETLDLKQMSDKEVLDAALELLAYKGLRTDAEIRLHRAAKNAMKNYLTGYRPRRHGT